MNDTLAWIASVLTVIAALIVAMSLGRKWTGWGFVLFSLASMLWIVIGFGDDEHPVAWQNVMLLAINVFGVYRWLLRPDSISPQTKPDPA